MHLSPLNFILVLQDLLPPTCPAESSSPISCELGSSQSSFISKLLQIWGNHLHTPQMSHLSPSFHCSGNTHEASWGMVQTGRRLNLFPQIGWEWRKVWLCLGVSLHGGLRLEASDLIWPQEGGRRGFNSVLAPGDIPLSECSGIPGQLLGTELSNNVV